MLDHKILKELETYLEEHLNGVEFLLYENEKFSEERIEEERTLTDLEDFIEKNGSPLGIRCCFGSLTKKGSVTQTYTKRPDWIGSIFRKYAPTPITGLVKTLY
ncbi:hypothetical protein [Salipaludibacillus keqinensis]|uniref:hypothetical protein n=1 Tax=Salipaludibacillus keqinensis TaxID=2045207 RepID=UPI001E643E2F|nr:hypothetical protein [Salipaludibacillus keqinensis]